MATPLDVDQLVSLAKQHLWLQLTNHSAFANQEPQIMVSGDGCNLTDARGNTYLDMLSGGVWCVNVGYGRESMVQAAAEQLRTLPYYAGTVANPPYILLAAKLASLLPSMPSVSAATAWTPARPSRASASAS